MEDKVCEGIGHSMTCFKKQIKEECDLCCLEKIKQELEKVNNKKIIVEEE